MLRLRMKIRLFVCPKREDLYPRKYSISRAVGNKKEVLFCFVFAVSVIVNFLISVTFFSIQYSVS